MAANFMKYTFSVLLAVSFFSFGGWLLHPATIARGQITFVQATPSRAQGQNQNQPGLPAEKKKSLSKYGPEDMFPGAREQEAERRQAGRANQRLAPTPTPSPTLTRSESPTQTPAETPRVGAGAATATPFPTTSQSLPTPVTRPVAASATEPPRLAMGLLLVAAVLVLAALFYVVSKLRRILRAGGSR